MVTCPLRDQRFLLRILAGWEAAPGGVRSTVRVRAGTQATPGHGGRGRGSRGRAGVPFLLPLLSGGSRGLYLLSVHQVQRGSDVRFGHGQREASRDAGRGARGPRGPPTLWWPRTPSATPRGARRVMRPFRHRGAFRWSLSPPLRRLSLGGTVSVSRREGTLPTPLSVRSARVGRRVRGGLRIVPAARHRQLIHPQDVRRRDAG